MYLKKILIPPAICSSKFFTDANNIKCISEAFTVSPFGHISQF
ncbi:hypothetical protein Nmel_011050 [Mimus melanotis]